MLWDNVRTFNHPISQSSFTNHLDSLINHNECIPFSNHRSGFFEIFTISVQSYYQSHNMIFGGWRGRGKMEGNKSLTCEHILTESRFFFDLLSSDSLSDKDFLLAPSVFSLPAFWEFRKASISSGQSKFSSGSHVLSALKHTQIYVKLGKEEKWKTSPMAPLKIT